MIAKSMLALGQSLDAITFALFFLLVPPYILEILDKTERNPILILVMQIGGVMGVIALKLLLTAWVIWRQKEVKPKLRIRVLTILAACSGFIGATFNTVAIVQILPVI